MRNRFALIGACLTLAALAIAPAASASQVEHYTCTANASWSVSLTSLSITYRNATCANAHAEAVLENLFPTTNIGTRQTSGPPFTQTSSFNSIFGLCLGTIHSTVGPWTGTGVLRNEGSFSTVAEIVATPNDGSSGAVTETHVGVFQTPCGSSFETLATWTIARVIV